MISRIKMQSRESVKRSVKVLKWGIENDERGELIGFGIGIGRKATAATQTGFDPIKSSVLFYFSISPDRTVLSYI